MISRLFRTLLASDSAMTRRSLPKFSDFDFDENDRFAELATRRFLASPSKRMRTGNGSRESSPITKYTFLEKFARGSEPADCTEVVNLEDSSEKRGSSTMSSRAKQLEDGPVKMEIMSDPSASISVSCYGRREKRMMKSKNKQLEEGPIDMEILSDDSTSSSSSRNETRKRRMTNSKNKQHKDDPVKVDIFGDHSTSSSSSCKIEPVATVLHEPSNTEATSTFSSAEIQVQSKKQPIELDSGRCDIERENDSVQIFPLLLFYRNSNVEESSLTFSSHGIKLEASNLDGVFSRVWSSSDIINIKAECSESVDIAMVSLYLRSENSDGSGNANNLGFELEVIAFYEPNWSEVQEAIKALNDRYKEIWNIDFDIDVVRSEKRLLGQISTISPEHDFSDSDEPFEDVIYPKGDRDAIIITKRDIERLKPETFLNDTIIDFYIKYLASKIGPSEKHRFHFFNCFFFKKLADLDKDQSSAYEGKVSFQRVCKWTRKVNIFEKDFIFIPVNYSLHWSLLVICYPGEVANFKDKEYDSLSKMPCILHMDSIRGSHKGLKNLMQRYLCEEWKERHSGTAAEEASSKFLNMRYVQLELPQQGNLSDCGLFLLHYVEKFVEEVPLEFSPFNITKFSNFLSKNWFPPSEASHKRYFIKKLLFKICDDHRNLAPEADSIEKDPSSESDSEEADVIVIEQAPSGFNDEEVGPSSLSKSNADSLLRLSGHCPRSYTHEDFLQSRSHHRNKTSLIEEDEETVPETPLRDVKDNEDEVTVSVDDFCASRTFCGSATSSKHIPETKHKEGTLSAADLFDLIVKDSEEEELECEVRVATFTSEGKDLRSPKVRSAEKQSFRGRNITPLRKTPETKQYKKKTSSVPHLLDIIVKDSEEEDQEDEVEVVNSTGTGKNLCSPKVRLAAEKPDFRHRNSFEVLIKKRPKIP